MSCYQSLTFLQYRFIFINFSLVLFLLALHSSIYLFLSLWLCCIFSAAWGLSLVAVSELPLAEHRLQYLQRAGSVVLGHVSSCAWHVGSSWGKDQTQGPYTGGQILNHWTTRETLQLHFLFMLTLWSIWNVLSPNLAFISSLLSFPQVSQIWLVKLKSP